MKFILEVHRLTILKDLICDQPNFVQYGGPLGPKGQRLQSCNHQWSRGAYLSLGTGT